MEHSFSFVNIPEVTNIRFNIFKKRKNNMTIYGYARISRPQQSIDRQVRNIKAYSPNAIIIQEAYTGTKMDRPKMEPFIFQNTYRRYNHFRFCQQDVT